VRIVIVDDEAPARAKMRRYVDEYPDIAIVGEAENGVEAVERIGELEPDLVFLDVQMPELDGFGVIREVGLTRLPGIVFVTAFDQYALQAFEVHAVDYLLKPFTRERLQAALARAQIRRRAEESGTDPRLAALLNELVERPRFLQRLPVRSGPRIVLLEAGQIDWIQAADNYVLLHAGAHEFLLRETMSRLEQELDPEVFVRIHRSAMVRIDRVAELQPSVHGDFRVTLKNGTYLTLSRFYRDRVERMLRKPL
jgi:two-component system LytT family response regulator